MRNQKSQRSSSARRQPHGKSDHPIFGLTILLVVLGLTLIIIAVIINNSNSTTPVIKDAAQIAALNDEFATFIGPGRKISEYDYVRCDVLTGSQDIGYGPLCEFSGHQLIIGQTGAVGVLCYGNYDGKHLNTHDGGKLANDQTFIIICKGCVAPKPWWNRIVIATEDYNIKLTNGRVLPYMQFWLPLPEGVTFDTPVAEMTIAASSWYWDGSSYVEASFSDTMNPDQYGYKSGPTTSPHLANFSALPLAPVRGHFHSLSM